MRKEIYLDLLDRALEQELGLAIETNNPSRLGNILYDYMKLDKYESLTVCVPSIPDHVFITQKTVSLDEGLTP